ncbi:MAG: hypothetical protein Q8P67_15225 [archaeon]|nr:hypothetical protein [archaeon]
MSEGSDISIIASLKSIEQGKDQEALGVVGEELKQQLLEEFNIRNNS